MQDLFEVWGYELLKKRVICSDKMTSGKINLPKNWRDKEVVVIRTEKHVPSKQLLAQITKRDDKGVNNE